MSMSVVSDTQKPLHYYEAPTEGKRESPQDEAQMVARASTRLSSKEEKPRTITGQPSPEDMV